MAKSMAAVTNGVVTNVIWCSDTQPETDTLKSPADRPLAIGDTYSGGKFYRDGAEILTPLEEALKTIAEMKASGGEERLKELDEAYKKGVDSV